MKKSNPRLGMPYGYWTEERVLESIRERVESGKPINPHSVQNDDGKLYAAYKSFFKSWGEAVEAAGFDYIEVSGAA